MNLHEAIRLSDFESIRPKVTPETVNAKDANGVYPLMGAIRYDRLSIVKYLVENGASLEVKDGDGYTPLLAAIDGEDLKIARYLLDLGAPVNPVDPNPCPPLLMSVFRQNYAIAKELIARGADVQARDDEGHFPLKEAVDHSDIPTAKLLIDAGAKIDDSGGVDGLSPLALAARNHDLIMMRFLLEAGADPHYRDVDYTTVLEVVYRVARWEEDEMDERDEMLCLLGEYLGGA